MINPRSLARQTAWTVCLAAGATASPGPVAAQPERPAECARLEAEAASRAALLFAPTVQAEVVRLPTGGDDTGEARFQGEGLQLRASLSHSLVDVWRGVVVQRVADWSCEELRAEARIARWLASASDAAERDALRARLDVLDRALPTVDAIEARAERLLAERRATLGDVDGLLGGAARIRLGHLRAASALARIDDDATLLDPAEVAADLHAYLAAAEARAAEGARLRRLQGWDLRLRGGVIPETPVDWYGGVELRWNVGSLVQGGHEARAAAAHREALRSASGGLVERVERLERRLAENAERLEGELALLARETDRVQARRTALAANEASSAVLARDAVELRWIELAAERAYLEALHASHTPFLRRARGRDGGVS